MITTALRNTRNAYMMLRGYPVEAARWRELISPMTRRTYIKRLLLAINICCAVEGVAGYFDVHASDVRARLGEVEAGLDRRRGISAE